MVTDSIRKRVFKAWVENPYLTPKSICKKLKLDYDKHGNYVKKLLSEFRSYYSFGSALKALPHRRVFVWRDVSRKLLLDYLGTDKFCRGLGWEVVANRNGMLVFRDDLGSVHWYRGGLVRLYLKGSVRLARAKELFCRAFSWFTPEQWSQYLDVPLREESKHWVFELGSPMPRFDIRQFERSHGLRIFTDGSHPQSLEVEETQPFWLDEFRETTGLFAEEIKEHLKLIRQWQKEAKAQRKKPGWLKRLLSWLW